MKRAKRRHVYRFKRRPLPKVARFVVDEAFRRWLARFAALVHPVP